MPDGIAANSQFIIDALRRIAARHKDAEVVRRLLALALVLEGVSRTEAARRNGMDYNLAYIPGKFLDTSTQDFDPVYMTKLYDLGFRMAQAGYPWKKTPPRMVGH